VKQRVAGLVGPDLSNAQLGPFAHGHWGHPAMKLPPEINLIAVSHYLQALEYQRYSNQVVAMLGGKTPHIQNVAVGGVANAINLESEAALNVDRLFQMKSLLEKIVSFVQNVYVPDVCAIAGLLSRLVLLRRRRDQLPLRPRPPPRRQEHPVRGFPEASSPTATSRSSSPSPARRTRPGAGPSPRTARTPGTKAVARCIPGKARPIRSPPSGTKRRSTPGSKPRATTASPRRSARSRMYSSAARRLVGYAQGHPLMKKWTDAALDKISAIAHVKATPAMLHSTLGRHGARAIRAAVLSELAMKQWQLLTDNILKGDTTIYNKPEFPKGTIEGVGFHEAPRGVLSHWVVIEDGTIKNYQAVVPTTWNASPRDTSGTLGPLCS
jgi:hydrogenase large subunit